ncbi:origin recognition complex subunit 4-like isoform X1 [Centruroides sculpturatus]|uniref:origin recognition complex subunit 4-like isoform X1 n=1 Tax=Centruroides sculpturatus TaxID=218467 RepID=UPI000C6E5FCF|nr:origin recognition complex subunit 4-like isoform X1 [Centruroides sculpturatus]
MNSPLLRRDQTENIYQFHQVLRKKLTFCSYTENLLGLEEQEKILKDLINRSIKLGESNSVLLIGPRGSGKTATLEKVKKELFQLSELASNCLQVNLNGLIHTDDQIALKDIILQLQLENKIEETPLRSFAETLSFLLEVLKSGNQNSKCILFTLDEFDLFCQHKNQTLLYNIFDVSQSARVPVVIVGLSCRLDVMGLLEKRVKSRFSHRTLYFFNKLNFKDYMKIAEDLLTLPRDFPTPKFRKDWNTHVKEILQDKTVSNAFQRLYNTSNDIRALKKFLIYPVSTVDETHPYMEASDFLDSQAIQILDSKAVMLHGLSILEFCLVITMMHLISVHEGESINFEIVYNEFQKYVQKKASLQHFERPVVFKAFEHLLAIELIKIKPGNSCNIRKNYAMVEVLLEPLQVREALQRYPNLPTELQQWASTVPIFTF